MLTPSSASRQPASLTASIPNFDPRQVPVIGTDSHLPAVPAAGQTPQALRARFAHPPRWQPEVRKEARFAPRTPAHAAVLVPLVLREELTVLLTQRTEQLSTHSGQVAFPGGRQDPEDADATATALREAQEEVGLDPGQVEVLGSLPVYETGTAFMVTPVVALVQPDAALHPNPYEVADVFEVPLRFLLDPAHHQRHRLHWQGLEREWFSMPYLDGGRERYIWGATAGMLRNFYRFMVA
ncbi:putative NUDIX hydrolase [Comamonas aquatica]|uniref:NUDIX hydrolase n=1 Tax=Comamonas aquatica TaxID=225991 RepID=A0AA35D4C4_9BURK|nr:putative NUDIX hydrolase [Comamonas aquatica]CAB5664249.1 putative NUDIX hydrolase [Comamonas aquatica]CAC9174450.1 putative NUDIX hydrolase [Comamonas aquatica]CAC9680130.1 putative NUDIX hydrolase [Comamonas aquatica]